MMLNEWVFDARLMEQQVTRPFILLQKDTIFIDRLTDSVASPFEALWLHSGTHSFSHPLFVGLSSAVRPSPSVHRLPPISTTFTILLLLSTLAPYALSSLYPRVMPHQSSQPIATYYHRSRRITLTRVSMIFFAVVLCSTRTWASASLIISFLMYVAIDNPFLLHILSFGLNESRQRECQRFLS
jgi:hypothetical protein